MADISSRESHLIGKYTLFWHNLTDWRKSKHRAEAVMNERFEEAKQSDKSERTSERTKEKKEKKKNLMNAVVEPGMEGKSRVVHPPVSKKHETKDEAKSDSGGETDKKTAAKEIKEAVGASQELIASATAIFPFNLFPDTIGLNRTHVIIAKREFFGVASIKNIRIEDIMTVSPNVGLFFGSIKITVTFVDDESPYMVNYLSRKDALKISRILKGYKLALEKGIDCSALSNQELNRLFDKLAEDGTDLP
jgi:hypothetical protein